MSQLKIGPVLRAELARLGLEARAYQPVHMFKKDPPRRLPRVPRDDDPWLVTLYREDRVIWRDGAKVGEAAGGTLEDAIRAAMPSGLVRAMLALEKALAGLTEAVHGCR